MRATEHRPTTSSTVVRSNPRRMKSSSATRSSSCRLVTGGRPVHTRLVALNAISLPDMTDPLVPEQDADDRADPATVSYIEDDLLIEDVSIDGMCGVY
jgi:mycofactocin precursor